MVLKIRVVAGDQPVPVPLSDSVVKGSLQRDFRVFRCA